jgi:flagellar basal body-associated protein FliL
MKNLSSSFCGICGVLLALGIAGAFALSVMNDESRENEELAFLQPEYRAKQDRYIARLTLKSEEIRRRVTELLQQSDEDSYDLPAPEWY